MFVFPSFSGAVLGAVLNFHAGQQPFSFTAPELTAQLGVPSTSIHGVVWYPADSSVAERQQTIGDPSAPLFEAGVAAPNAPLAASPRRFPLVLISHGTGGSAEQMAWLGTTFARAGFIAVAIDHPGNTSLQKTVQGFTLWWLRARELSRALDTVLADPTFGPHVDRERIGAAGFSIGGYTAIALAGARVDVSQFESYCEAHPDAPSCEIPEFPHLATEATALQSSDSTYARALTQSGESVWDARVRSAYAIAPAAGRSVTTQSLAAIAEPVRIVYGTDDTIVLPAENAERYANAIAGATLLTVRGAGHYTFLDVCVPAAVAMLGDICRDDGDVDREEVHDRVARDAVEFFKRTLRGPNR
jgi:predicted dienelactone hydrolase